MVSVTVELRCDDVLESFNNSVEVVAPPMKLIVAWRYVPDNVNLKNLFITF